jgi:hypothetical protein
VEGNTRESTRLLSRKSYADSSPRQDQRKIMIMRLSTVLSVASLIAVFADAPGAAAELVN